MNLTPYKAVGVGLRAPHLSQFIRDKPKIAWLEAHTENYFHPTEQKQLEAIRHYYPISLHGVGMSLGSVDSLDRSHLKRVKHLVDQIDPIAISEHLSWSSINQAYANDLLPLPYTQELLDLLTNKIHQVQEALQRPLKIENPSTYLQFTHSTWTESAFLAELQRTTGCELLLDLNNVYVNSLNHGFTVSDYLAEIDPQTVTEIHLAGFITRTLPEGHIHIDSHSQPVCSAVWQLYQTWIQQHGIVPTLIEWDQDIPSLSRLLQEARTAQSCLEQHQNQGHYHEFPSRFA